MNKLEVFELLKETLDNYDISLSDIINWDYNEETEEYMNETFGEISEVETFRNGYKNSKELQDQYTILHFSKHDFYVKVEGEYNSWEGSDWSSLKLVNPVEKTITVYEEV